MARCRYRPISSTQCRRARWPRRPGPQTASSCAVPGRDETEVLAAHELSYRRDGQQILTGIGLSVAAGQSLAVTGPSGSGKTSLLAILAGLTAPTAGIV